MSGTYNEPDLLEKAFVEEQTEEEKTAEIKALGEQLEAARKEIIGLGYKLDQARKREADLGKALRREKQAREMDRRDHEQETRALRESRKRSVVMPCIVIAVFALLSLLTGMCVDRGWMIALLGELLICAFLCVSAFFGGIVWNRTAK